MPVFGVDVYGKVTEWKEKAVEISGCSNNETVSMLVAEEFIAEAFR